MKEEWQLGTALQRRHAQGFVKWQRQETPLRVVAGGSGKGRASFIDQTSQPR